VDPELIEMEKQFTESLGTRVQIERKDFGGKLVIDYFSPEDLRKILALVSPTAAISHTDEVHIDMTGDAPLTEAGPALDDRSKQEQDDADLYALKNFSL
jgi:hypothetical protein